MDSPKSEIRGETRRLLRLRIAQVALRVCLLSSFVASGLSSVVLGGPRISAQAPAPSATAQEAMQQGAQAMTAGNFDAAVTASSTVTREVPNFPEGEFNSG